MADRICDNCMNRVPINAEKCPQCGIQFENTNPGGALPNGWVLAGRYTIGRYIGIDGEGVTYSAIDAHTMQRVTIKEFMPVTLSANRDTHGAIIPKPGSEVLLKTTRMDFAEMYGALMRMGLVDGLVQVLDVIEENNTAYGVLEKVEGTTLEEYLAKVEEPLDIEKTLTMLRPVLIGLEELHAASLVHRGISLDNIIMESGGTTKLTGYATLALRQMGSELKPKLYSGYSAPEQYAASEFEGQYTDVYALAAVVYRLITGEEPIPADERKVQDTLKSARQVNKEVPAYVSSGLSRAMRINSDERIQNIHDLRLALTGESDRGMVEKKGPFGLTRQQLIVGGAALGAVLILLLVILFISLFAKGRPDPSMSISASVDMQIPNFEEMLYTDIVKNEKYEHFVFDPPQEEYDEEVEAGRVISQKPEAGSIWDGKTPIRLVVSKGPEEAEMPDLIGKNISEASSILNAMGVKFEQEQLSNDGRYEKGEVLRTTPTKGTKLKVGKDQRDVVLYIAGEATGTQIPNVANKSRPEAVDILNRANIRFTEQIRSNNGEYIGGTAAGTEPGAGTEINVKKDTIKLIINDKYYMPNLNSYVGRQLSDLTSFLNQRKVNFSYQTSTITTDDPALSGTVASVDFPPINSEVFPGTTIYIEVYG